ncbi:hypothetical protein [Nocardia sp. NPDC004604]|uniref:hypothetical protein n=1 Tax=Nocardia sp. NPDC004604 TaxID=3157013 RepID=UPI0033BB0F90
MGTDPVGGVSAGIWPRRITHLLEQASLVILAVTVPQIFIYLLLFPALFEAHSSYARYVWTLTAAALVGAIIRILADERSVRRWARKFYGREARFFGQWGIMLPTECQGKRKIHTYLTTAAKLPDKALSSAIDHLVSPHSFNRRVGHAIEMENGDYYRHKILKRVELPSTLKGNERIIPAVRLRKGAPVNDLVFKFGDKRTSALPFDSGQGLVAYALTRKLTALVGNTIDTNDTVWLSILSAVISEYPKYRSSDSDRGSQFRLHHYLDALQEQMTQSKKATSQEIDQFIRLVEELCEDWVIWVIAPDDSGSEWQHLVVEHRIIAHDRTSNVYERLRTRLGLQHRNLILVMPLALEAQSYHLDLSAPPGMYLYNVKLALVNSADIKDKMKVARNGKRRTYRETLVALEKRDRHRGSTGGWKRGIERCCIALAIISNDVNGSVRLGVTSKGASPMLISNGLGSNFVHVYARQISSLTLRYDTVRYGFIVPVAKLEFRERPPGNIAIVTLLSLYIAGMAWAISRIHDTVLSKITGPNPWSVIIFGTPAIISAWVVSRFVGGNAARSSLITAAMIAWAVANSIAVVAYAALVQGGAKIHTFNLREPNAFPWIVHPDIVLSDTPWVLILFSCTAHLVLAIGMYTSRTSRYMSRLRMALISR